MHLEIKKAATTLKEGKLILFPTDTFLSIGCDATNPEALEKLFKLNKSNETTCLIADDRMLKKYVKQVPFAALSIIEISDTPTTIIYDNPQNLATNLIGTDNTVAIRIPDDEFCYQLSRRLNGAIAISSANIFKNSSKKSFKEIAPAILKGVDYVVNLQKEKNHAKPASIIKLSSTGIVEVLQK